MLHETFIDGILRERRDDTARTVTTYGPTGQATGTRAYTSTPNGGENAAADARAAGVTFSTNAETLRAKATTALAANATYLGIGTPTNAQNLAQIRALTRQVQALIRLEVRALSDTAGT